MKCLNNCIADVSGTSPVTRNVTIDGNNINVDQALGNCCDINLHIAQNWTIKNNTFGPSCCGSTTSNSPVAINVGKSTSAMPSTCSNEVCNLTIQGNLFQYILRNCSYWPSSGWGPCPQQTCSASTCHLDSIHIFGCITCDISYNRFYGDECTGIFIESPVNGDLNQDFSIIGNVSTALAGQCDGFISIKAVGNGIDTAGHWKIGFNESPAQLNLGQGWTGFAPGTVFDIYGNYASLFITGPGGNNAGCNAGNPPNVTINYSYNVWLTRAVGTRVPCGATDTTAVSGNWVNAAPAPAVGLDMTKTGPSVANSFVVCALVLNGCPAQDLSGKPRGQNGRAAAGAFEP